MVEAFRRILALCALVGIIFCGSAAAQDDVDGGYSRGYNSGYNGNGENSPPGNSPYAQGFRQGQDDGDTDNDEQVEREERMMRGDRNETDNQQ